MTSLPGILHDSSDECSDFELLHPTEADNFALSEEEDLETSKPPAQADGESESESEASEVESVPLDGAAEASDDEDEEEDGDGERRDGGGEEAAQGEGAEVPPSAEAAREVEDESEEEPEEAAEDSEEEESEEQQKHAEEEEDEVQQQQKMSQLPDPAEEEEADDDPEPEPAADMGSERLQELEATIRRLQSTARLLVAACAALALVAGLASAMAAYAWSSRNECVKSRQLKSLISFDQDKFIRPMGSLPSSFVSSTSERSRLPLNRIGRAAVPSQTLSSNVEEKLPRKLQAALAKPDWFIGRLNFTASLNASLQEGRSRLGAELKGLRLQRGRAGLGLGRAGLLWEKELLSKAPGSSAAEMKAALDRKDSQIVHLKQSAASKDAMIESLRDLAVSLRAALQDQHRLGETFKAASERKDVVIQSLNKTSAFMQVLLERQHRSSKRSKCCVCRVPRVRSRHSQCAEDARVHAALRAGGDRRGILQLKLVHDSKVLFTFNVTMASLEKKLRERGTFFGRLHGDMLKVALPQKENLLRSLGAAASAAGPPSSSEHDEPCAVAAAALLCPPTGVSREGLCGPAASEASASGQPLQGGGAASPLPMQLISTPLLEGLLQPPVRREPFVRSALGGWGKLTPAVVGTAQRVKVAPQQLQPGRRALSWPATSMPRTKDVTTCDSRFLGKTCANALGECRTGGDQNENLDCIETRRAAFRAEEETTWRMSIARVFRTMASEMPPPQTREEDAYAELWPLSRAPSVNRTGTAPTKASRASLSFPLLARSRMS